MSISPVFSIAQRALLTNEVALNVVGENIANVNTPGYTRQVPDLQANDPAPVGGGVTVGTGVHVAAVRQVIDPLLERQLLGAATDTGAAGTRSDQLSVLSSTLSDLDTPSLGSTLSGFFDAAYALARNPGGLAERETLLARAQALANETVRRHDAVASLQRSIDSRIVDTVDQANADLAHIAQLNTAIGAAQLGGNPANELRDQRRQALNDLAGIVGISSVEDARGIVTVSAANGLVLVSERTVTHPLAVQESGTGIDGLPLHDVGTLDATGAFLSVSGAFDSGTLGALVGLRDGEVADAAAQLDTFATSLRDAVNLVQTDPAARDLDGNATTSSPLFAGTGAGDLTVALSDPRQIAAALSSAPGDNTNALQLAGLRSATEPGLGGISFTDYLAAQQAKLGEDAASASDASAANQALGQQLNAQRASLSGVNLNEELTNLLKYQRAFQAASQMIGVANSMLDDLLKVL